MPKISYDYPIDVRHENQLVSLLLMKQDRIALKHILTSKTSEKAVFEKEYQETQEQINYLLTT